MNEWTTRVKIVNESGRQQSKQDRTAVVVITPATLLLSATVGISGERKDKGKGAKRTEEKAAEAMISQGADSSQNQKKVP